MMVAFVILPPQTDQKSPIVAGFNSHRLLAKTQIAHL